MEVSVHTKVDLIRIRFLQIFYLKVGSAFGDIASVLTKNPCRLIRERLELKGHGYTKSLMNDSRAITVLILLVSDEASDYFKGHRRCPCWKARASRYPETLFTCSEQAFVALYI